MFKNVRSSLLIAAVIGAFTVAAFADFMVNGNGVASGSDQSTADSKALSQAQAQANAICPTVTSNMETTGDNCISTGNDQNPGYVCTVTVKALCHTPQAPAPVPAPRRQ